MTEDEENEAAEISEFAATALRAPRKGVFEQLLCQHLVQATVSADPLRKIQLVVEAALMVDEVKQKSLEIDFEKLEIIRAISEAFRHRNEVTNKTYDGLVTVRFGFEESEENYNRYIEPWYHGEHLIHYPNRLAHLFSNLGTSYRIFHCASCQNVVADSINGKIGYRENQERCKFCGADLSTRYNGPPAFTSHISFKPHETTSAWQMFFAYCNALAQSGFNQLKTDFLEWAMPFVMELVRKLTEVVGAEIYNEIAKMFIKAKGEVDSEP